MVFGVNHPHKWPKRVGLGLRMYSNHIINRSMSLHSWHFFMVINCPKPNYYLWIWDLKKFRMTSVDSGINSTPSGLYLQYFVDVRNYFFYFIFIKLISYLFWNYNNKAKSIVSFCITINKIKIINKWENFPYSLYIFDCFTYISRIYI